MREQEAMTDPYTPITEIIGSGPFRFVKSEYRPGARLVYDKNPFYVPRGEPVSGFSGGKLVKVDRVEFIIIPDSTVAIAALRNGEVDFIDSPSLDVVPTVANDPNIVIGEVWPIETYAVLRPNSIQPPFPTTERQRACTALGCAFLPCFPVLCPVLVHVAATLFHALVRRDGVFEAMAPVSTHHEVRRPSDVRSGRRKKRFSPHRPNGANRHAHRPGSI
jgi:hypothetical protein